MGESVGGEYTGHQTLNHAQDEHVRGAAHTDGGLRGCLPIFKRGMKGIYQHCGEQHLQRYLAEFDFRFNNREIEDAERRDKALKGIEGKRLTYQQPNP